LRVWPAGFASIRTIPRQGRRSQLDV